MARDISAEILAKQNRSKENKHNNSLEALIRIYQEENYNQEFLKYIPIATKAYIENNIRSNIANLIDFGAPYNDNVKNNLKKI